MIQSPPRIGRVQVWVDCVCGAEVVFEDADPEGYVVQECKICHRSIEVIMSADVRDVSSAAVRRALES